MKRVFTSTPKNNIQYFKEKRCNEEMLCMDINGLI